MPLMVKTVCFSTLALRLIETGKRMVTTWATPYLRLPPGSKVGLIRIAEDFFLLCAFVALAAILPDSGAGATVARIEAVVTERVGAAQTADLSPLAGLLEEASTLLSDKLSARPEETRPESPIPQSGPTAAQAGAGAGQTATFPGGAGDDVRSREDVVRILDKLCEYYVRNEPSSPVPMLLKRAQRLVTKDFIDIVRDLAPEALAKMEAIRGKEGDS